LSADTYIVDIDTNTDTDMETRRGRQSAKKRVSKRILLSYREPE